jgi:hypothetical protein
MNRRNCWLFAGFLVIVCLAAAPQAGCGTMDVFGESASGPDTIAGSTTTVTATAGTAGFSTSTAGSSALAMPTVASTAGSVSAPPLIGHAYAGDPTGDVDPFDNRQPARQPASVDLVYADLTADGQTLTIRLTTSGPIPHSFDTGISSDDQMVGLEFGVWFRYPSGGFNLGAYLWHDWVVDERMSGPPRVSGNVVILMVPLASVPELAQGFEWTACADCDYVVGTADEKYGDRIPGAESARYSSEDPAFPFPGR